MSFYSHYLNPRPVSLCCWRFMSTETVGLLGMGAQDGHLNFHTVPELWPMSLLISEGLTAGIKNIQKTGIIKPSHQWRLIKPSPFAITKRPWGKEGERERGRGWGWGDAMQERVVLLGNRPETFTMNDFTSGWSRSPLTPLSQSPPLIPLTENHFNPRKDHLNPRRPPAS